MKIIKFYITDSHGIAVFYETREVETMARREMASRYRGCYSMQGQAGQGDDQRSAQDNVGTGTDNQKIPVIRDFLKWTRGGLHPFHQVLTLICYFIHHGPGSTFSLYKTATETSKQKEPLLQEVLFVAPDNVRNVRTISVSYSIAKPI